MRILVRYVSHKGKLNDTLQEVPLTGSRLKIGRGTDQDIHLSNLRVALAHAELIEGQDGQVRLQSHLAAGFHYNGDVVQSAVLDAGDRIELGGHILRVGDAAGCDLALEVSEDTSTRGREMEAALLKRARLDLTAAGLRKRPVALAAAGIILVLFLLVPIIAATVPAAGKWLRMLPLLPSDHAWQSGAVSDAHANFGVNCNACHTIPFVPTRNAACLTCHKGTAHHVDNEILKTGLFKGQRCASCHHEHTGKSSLIRKDEGLCVSCHSDLKDKHKDTQLLDVRSFGEDHPEFRATLARDVDGKQVLERVPLSDAKALHETPGIEFSHQGHLDPKGIESPSRGTVKLACGDCHQAEPGGGRMQAVKFENNCHECHQLNIPGDVVREVPHGDLKGAVNGVSDYFQAWALRGGYPNALAPNGVQTRRLPGQPISEADKQDALSWAARNAEMTTAEMLAYTTCGKCHTVKPTGKGNGAEAWHIDPVRIPDAWLPAAHFSHKQHDTQPCSDCHAQADKSETSADVMLPGIATCRTCHGSGDAGEGKLASGCVTCHGFHQAKDAKLK